MLGSQAAGCPISGHKWTRIGQSRVSSQDSVHIVTMALACNMLRMRRVSLVRLRWLGPGRACGQRMLQRNGLHHIVLVWHGLAWSVLTMSAHEASDQEKS